MVNIKAITMENTDQLENFDTEKPLRDGILYAEKKLSTEEGGVGEQERVYFQEVEQPENSSHSCDHVVRVLVDNTESSNTFEYHHGDLENSLTANSRSIFAVKHQQSHHLFSLGNERPDNNLTNHSEAQFSQHNKNREKSTTTRRFLPELVDTNKQSSIQTKSDTNSILCQSSRINKKGKKTKQLFDYNNPSYLEHSRRSRRRKQSEVDIEVGLRLSRFVQQPYEGCVDKYSKKYRQKLLHKRKGQNHTPESSADSSPLGSSSEQINTLKPSRLTEYDEEQLRSYLWRRRGLRRRSLSSSPPRCRSNLLSDHRDSVSQSVSPSFSPSSSVGPSSPARYRKTNFATILNSAKKREELQLRLRPKEASSILPQIHQHKESNAHKQSTFFDEKFFSQSLPNANDATNSFRKRAGTFSEFQNYQSNTSESNMSKIEVQSSKKAKPVPVPPPPANLRKHVQVNTSVPCGSPSFQRVMQGMQPPNESTVNNNKGSVEIRKKPTVTKPQPNEARVRIHSAGGRRRVFKRSPSSACASPRPNFGHHVSFGDDLVTAVDHDSDETISELRDKLTSLRADDTPAVMPAKSILKNRRRSIDDLDVGTKKGLAMYLKSKHKFNRRHNGHLH